MWKFDRSNKTLTVKADKFLLQKLSESMEELEKAGINIAIQLKSNAFLDVVGEEGEQYLEIKNTIIDALEKLTPFVCILRRHESEHGKLELKQVLMTFLDSNISRVKCPFCSHEQDYVTALLPYVYPEKCQCGAGVSADIGDAGDIYESLYIKGMKLIKAGDREIIAERDGMRIIAIEVDEEFWFIFMR